MTFETWLHLRTPGETAKRVGVSPRVIYHWRERNHAPRLKQMKKINQVSGGTVSYQSICEHFLGK